MKQQVIPAGGGPDYDWASDHIYVKSGQELSGGRVTVVEDTLKPGFHLARHHHKRTTEIFYILAGDVLFTFDDEVVHATAGMTVSIPTGVAHDVRCEHGGRLLTVFAPGGFDQYLSVLAAQTPEESVDAAVQKALAEQYDTWML